MSSRAIDAEVTALLAGLNARGGYPMSLVCTDRGLLLAFAGEVLRSEVLAGLTSLFDDILARAARDLGLSRIEELSLWDCTTGRVVVRPLACEGHVRLFLVVQVPPDRSWRRNTNQVARKLLSILRPWLSPREDLS